MSKSGSLSTCFDTLRIETLPSLGVDDSTSAQIIAGRLIIERVGERDVNYWWDSQVLSNFGRDTLEETTPRTATRARIDLAMQVGRKVENDAIEGEAVLLFDLGPFVESRIERALDDIDGSDKFTCLEEYSTEIVEPGWTEPLVEVDTTLDTGSGRTTEVGELNIEDLQKEEVLDDVVSQLIYAYGDATKNELKIPYFKVKR